MKEQTMKVTAFTAQTNFNSSHRREKIFYESYEVVVYDSKKGFSTPISLRMYGTNAKNYACIWINAKDMHCSGTGDAGGYGYHRASAAAADAFKSAGFEFNEAISGRGESAIHSALKAITKHLGFKKFTIVNTHA